MIRIGVVGLGIGRAFFDIVRDRDDARITAICDVDERTLRRVSEQEGITAAYTGFDEMLAADIDAVVVATPIQVHGGQAIAAMKAGKHVLCEYVAATDEREAEALVRTAQESGTTYMFIETDCWERKNVVMKELARRGVFGELTMGRGHYIHDCKTMGRNPDGSLTWRGELWMASPGGGAAAVHNAMPLLEIFGERVVEVYSYGPGSRTMPEYANVDRVTTVGKLPSGRIVELVHDVFSWHPRTCGYTLQGTKGCFEFDRAAIVEDGKLSPWKDLDALEAQYGIAGTASDSAGHSPAWSACLSAFLHAVEGGARPPQDLFDALHITAIGWAANESLRSGLPAKVVQFD